MAAKLLESDENQPLSKDLYDELNLNQAPTFLVPSPEEMKKLIHDTLLKA